MNCKYCGRKTIHVTVCGSCSTIECDLRKYAEPQGTLRMEHDNNWAIQKADSDYNGVVELV